MHNRYTFIAIEGVDGIGKTTIARRLVKNLNAFYMKVPPPSFKWVARLLDKFCNPEIESIGYYLLAIYTSFLIRRLLKRRSVICDKFIILPRKIARLTPKRRS